MTREEHYREAELLVEMSKGNRLSEQGITWTLARALIHATLATASPPKDEPDA